MAKKKPEAAPVFAGKIHIAVVLDKSGSMGSVRRETIDGFNTWLAVQQAVPGEADLTLTLFASIAETPFVAAPIGKVNPLDEARYQPSGNTALLDASMQAITGLEEFEKDSAGDRFIVCIMTDGQENASTKTTKEALAAKIKEKEATGRWTFTYLSAHPDAFTDATSIGISVANTQAYTGDGLGTQSAFLSNANRMADFRFSANLATMDFYGGQQHAGVAQPPRIPQFTPPAAQASPRLVDQLSTPRSSGWLRQ